MKFHPQIPVQQRDRAPVGCRHLALFVVASERPAATVHRHPIYIPKNGRNAIIISRLRVCISVPAARVFFYTSYGHEAVATLTRCRTIRIVVPIRGRGFL